jgi:hypothetical protein
MPYMYRQYRSIPAQAPRPCQNLTELSSEAHGSGPERCPSIICGDSSLERVFCANGSFDRDIDIFKAFEGRIWILAI